MLFNSLHYLLFFPAVAFLYFRTPPAWRWILLLLASCYFYMAFIPSYILILFVLILVDYSAGLLIERYRKQAKPILLISLAANIAGLAFFKYFNFINENLSWLAAHTGFVYQLTYLDIILPIGLSFHTFQSMAYTIDVYRGQQKAEKHLGYYALYVLFFPQMVAGPIERAQSLLPQLKAFHKFDPDNLLKGGILISWGLLKKVVIADRLALIVNPVYGNPQQYNGFELLIATYLFAVQIYCDFSGYTSIARGSARILGIQLVENFHNPYFAIRISSFWKRWHMSLSSWFRDYVYIPLGGNRKGLVRWSLNILLVFMLSGLWHGASWNFVIWGLLHGCFLLVEQLIFRKDHPSTPFGKILAILITFHLVTFAWIFFRAESTSDALLIIQKIVTGFIPEQGILDRYFLAILLPLTGGLFLAEYHKRTTGITALNIRPFYYFSFVTLLIILLGQSNQEAFIYFQF